MSKMINYTVFIAENTIQGIWIISYSFTWCWGCPVRQVISKCVWPPYVWFYSLTEWSILVLFYFVLLLITRVGTDSRAQLVFLYKTKHGLPGVSPEYPNCLLSCGLQHLPRLHGLCQYCSASSSAAYLCHASWNPNLCLPCPALGQGICINSHTDFAGMRYPIQEIPAGLGAGKPNLHFLISGTPFFYWFYSPMLPQEAPRQRNGAHPVCVPSLKDSSPMPVFQCLKTMT